MIASFAISAYRCMRTRKIYGDFLCNEGIEPTNNAAEQALRNPVVYRKLSFGTQSEGGIRFVEQPFSVVETCRLQSERTRRSLRFSRRRGCVVAL